MAYGYREALEAAGGKILNFSEFGSRQGDWYAQVEYNGERGWIKGSYGSCSYCDSFEAEFGYDYIKENEEQYQSHLADFGRSYLETILPAKHYIEILQDGYDFDGTSSEIVSYIKANDLGSI